MRISSFTGEANAKLQTLIKNQFEFPVNFFFLKLGKQVTIFRLTVAQ